MTAADLKAWRTRLGMTQGKAAAALGLSLRAIQNYEGGFRPIPLPVELACEGYEARLSKGVDHG